MDEEYQQDLYELLVEHGVSGDFQRFEEFAGELLAPFHEHPSWEWADNNEGTFEQIREGVAEGLKRQIGLAPREDKYAPTAAKYEHEATDAQVPTLELWGPAQWIPSEDRFLLSSGKTYLIYGRVRAPSSVYDFHNERYGLTHEAWTERHVAPLKRVSEEDRSKLDSWVWDVYLPNDFTQYMRSDHPSERSKTDLGEKQNWTGSYIPRRNPFEPEVLDNFITYIEITPDQYDQSWLEETADAADQLVRATDEMYTNLM